MTIPQEASSLIQANIFTCELLTAELLFMPRTIRRKHFIPRFATATALLIALSSCLRYQPDTTLLIARFAIIFASTLWMIAACAQCTMRKIVQIGVCGYLVQHIAYELFEIVKATMSMLGIGALHTYWVSLAVEIAVFAGIYAAFYAVYIRAFNRIGRPLVGTRFLLLVGSILTIVIVMSVYAISLNGGMLVLFRCISILSCVMVLAVMKELLENHKLQEDVASLARMNEQTARHYERLKDTIEATNVRCHDVKHQISRLRAANGKQGQTDVAGILDDIEQSINIYDGIAKTGNAALDIVLTEKSLLCAKEDIHFTYMADGHALDKLEDRDVYSLFGNILDNAIEASRAITEPSRRVIDLMVSRRGNIMSVRADNYYDHQLQFVDGLPHTTKADAANHGFGLASIRMTVSKYDGDMSIETNDGMFSLNLVMVP